MTGRSHPRTPMRRRATSRWAVMALMTGCAGLSAVAAPAGDESGLDLLRDPVAFEERVVELVDACAPATVGLRVGGASGSGVIVSPDGLILTAGHVSGAPGRSVQVLLADGRRLQGRTLGDNQRRDSGMVQIEDAEELPFVEIADGSTDIERGQWCVAIGHPGGFDSNRTTVARIGRVQDPGGRFLHSDCPIVGGDSGGPLFDLEGRVIGIHSRISTGVTENYHVPIGTFRSTWQRLVAKQRINIGRAKFGIRGMTDRVEGGLQVDTVFPGRAASVAGLVNGDVLLRFGGERVRTREDLVLQLADRLPGDLVELQYLRDGDACRTWIVLESPAQADSRMNRTPERAGAGG